MMNRPTYTKHEVLLRVFCVYKPLTAQQRKGLSFGTQLCASQLSSTRFAALLDGSQAPLFHLRSQVVRVYIGYRDKRVDL